jgi:hypothetical protein
MNKRLTNEQKAAKKLADIVNDLTLDLDLVGIYLAQYEATVLHNRLIVVIESADNQKEIMNVRNNLDPLF